MSSDNAQTAPDTAHGQTRGLSAFDKLPREVSRREILDDYELLAHNTRLYLLENDWKSVIIKEDFTPKRVETLTQLEAAVANPDDEIILIPETALISREGLERICQRNAQTKVIFTERDL